MFGALNAFLFRPLPFRNPNRLVMLWETNPKLEGILAQRVPTCLQNYLDWQAEAKSFSGIAALNDTNLNLTGVDKPEQIEIGKVSPNFFDLIGVKAASGRTFVSGEGEPGKDRVAVLTRAFFEKRFGHKTELSGKSIALNGVSYFVIGVLPGEFHLASAFEGADQKRAQVFIPVNVSPDQAKAPLQARDFFIYARLQPSVKLEQARAEMEVIGKRLEQKNPSLNSGFGGNVTTLSSEDVGGDMRLALVVLQCAVGFVLLIACANLANLLLARATGREKESAVRMALGASRGRIVLQFLTESMVLSVLGGIAGLLLAHWGIDAVNRYAPTDMLGSHTLQLDFRVFGFTFVVVALAGVLFGAAPAVHAVRHNINEALMNTARSVVGRSGKTRSALVIIEVTLAVVLLVGSGLTLRSLYALRHVNPGFMPDHLLTAQVRLPGERYQKPEQVSAFCDQLLQRVKALPGVKSAALASGLPMQDIGVTSFRLEGQAAQSDSDYLLADYRQVSEDYLAVMGSPLLRGRGFTREEAVDPKPGVVIINESMAKKFWPGQDAIGKIIIFGGKANEQRVTIVGVVGDSHQLGLDTAPRTEMYRPGRSFSRLSVVARTAVDPLQIANELTAQVLAIDKDQPVAEIHSMQEVIDGTMAGEQFGTSMMLIFAVLAVLLCSVGLYGVLSYLVSQRTQEIGIRLALGAPRNHLLRMVVRQGMALALGGMGIGLVASLVLGRTISSLLYGVKPADPFTLIGTVVLLFFISLLASYVPARRATRVDPMVALRYE
jgi:putative ABC transport system permease protein